ncbi:hypothetical protein [Bradyrhizobium manausense]|uniref:hypothetical protein n=1 Tax=Bradyrhizobium manausense TaxID=989370 RepID=UPI000A76B476|nr:hypothetical protein [Bradyrhizobium manausense]
MLDPQHVRVMICESLALVRDARELLNAKGFVEGNDGSPRNSWSKRRLPNSEKGSA